MKIKFILPILCLYTSTNAQSVSDTVSLGAGYGQQVWYSLSNDNQGTAPKNNWDIMFEVSGFGSSIHINSVTGTLLWKYPHADTSGWSSLDTTGISIWKPLYNSDTTWTTGAFDIGKVVSNPYDLGWGVYNSITHVVAGDSLYIIKLADGAYKKLYIESLAGGTYYFKYADISGTNLFAASISKSSFSSKNFAYYSISSNSVVDREPDANNWDLLFTPYTAFIPSPYTVAGVLSNKNVTVAQANGISNTSSYTNWAAHSYSHAINEIGYDWKTFAGTWFIEDSLVYFVRSTHGDVWKMIYTGFGGSANGNYYFTKELISPNTIHESDRSLKIISIFPNPCSGNEITIVFENSENIGSDITITITELNGKTVLSSKLVTNQTLQKSTFSTAGLSSGLYLVTMASTSQLAQQKLVIY